MRVKQAREITRRRYMRWKLNTNRQHDRYRAYIASKHWYERRLAWVNSFSMRHPDSELVCFSCGASWDVRRDDLHHASYQRLGNERDEDLWAMCRDCHNELHSMIRSSYAWRRLSFESANRLALAKLRQRK